MQELPFGERSAKHILFHIFKQIVNYKKQDSSKGEVRVKSLSTVGCCCVCRQDFRSHPFIGTSKGRVDLLQIECERV